MTHRPPVSEKGLTRARVSRFRKTRPNASHASRLEAAKRPPAATTGKVGGTEFVVGCCNDSAGTAEFGPMTLDRRAEPPAGAADGYRRNLAEPLSARERKGTRDRIAPRAQAISRRNRPAAAIGCADWPAARRTRRSARPGRTVHPWFSRGFRMTDPCKPAISGAPMRAGQRPRADHLPIGVFAQFAGQIARPEPDCRSGRASPRRARGVITRSPRSAQKHRVLQHGPLITCRPGDRAPGAPIATYQPDHGRAQRPQRPSTGTPRPTHRPSPSAPCSQRRAPRQPQPPRPRET